MKTEQGEIPALFSCRKAWGLARRLRRGRRACSPMGRSIVSGGDPKVSKGERREASIQWIQPPKAVTVCQKRSRIAAFFDIIGDNNRSR